MGKLYQSAELMQDAHKQGLWHPCLRHLQL